MPTFSHLSVPGHRKRPWRRLFQLPCGCRHLLPLTAVAYLVLTLQSVAQDALDQYPQCVSNLWSAGSQLGRAEAIARYDAPDAQSQDTRMVDNMHAAGHSVEKANAHCAQHPTPWPAWPHWNEIQGQLTEMGDRFQSGLMNRQQLEVELAALEQSLAFQLDSGILPNELESTCMEIYMRLAVALGFAQTTTETYGRITRDATVRLRQALSLVYQTRDMAEPCLDFMGLIPAIGEALKNPDDPSVVGRVNNIWHAGEGVAAPRTE
jgi:hypothetical protein